MSINQSSTPTRPARRSSVLGERLTQEKLEEARALSPTQRLLLALQLSDTCLELQRSCSTKR